MKARAALLAAAGLFLAGASLTAHRQVAAGNAALERGDPREAAAHYEAALAEGPDDPAVRYDLGTARLAAGDLDAAVDDLGRAARAAVGDLEARAAYNLGNALMARAAAPGADSRADLEGAVEAYRQSLNARPGDPDARRNLQLAATRLAALPENPPPSGGGQGKPGTPRGGAGRTGPSGQGGKSGPDAGSGSKGSSGQPGQAGAAGQAGQPGSQGRSGAPNGPEPSKSGSAAGEQPGTSPGASPGPEGHQPGAEGTQGESGEGAATASGQGPGAPGSGGADATRTPLPDEVARVLSTLRGQEIETLRQALRRGMGEAQPEDKDW